MTYDELNAVFHEYRIERMSKKELVDAIEDWQRSRNEEIEPEEIEPKDFYIFGTIFERDFRYVEIGFGAGTDNQFTAHAILTEDAIPLFGLLEHKESGHTLHGMNGLSLPLHGTIVYGRDNFIIVEMSAFESFYLLVEREETWDVTKPKTYTYDLDICIAWLNAFQALTMQGAKAFKIKHGIKDNRLPQLITHYPNI